jgi:hypothetical protein
MNRPRGDAGGRSHEGTVRSFVTFLTMVVAEWQKLVAEVSHAFAGRRDRGGANNQDSGSP